MLLRFSNVERASWLRILLPLLAGLVIASAAHNSSRAAEQDENVFAISREERGLAQCIAQRLDCGKTAADAWCEAKGRGRALAFGAASDITGAVRADAKAPADKAPEALVRCAE